MSADPKHTNVGCGVLSWPPYLALYRDHPMALHLWWTLYLGRKAKTLLPGLWLGGVLAMADEANLTVGEADAALKTLVDKDMVEHDPQHGVTRFTKLPDRCERAMNPNMLFGWWDRREQVIPACGVRERHLELMAWLHLPFKPSRRGKEGAEGKCQAAWDETFGPALAALRSGSVSTGGHGGSASGAPPLQLSLYVGPDQSNGSLNGSPNRPVPDQDQVSAAERGEVQERGRPPAPIIPLARAGLELGARELEAIGLEVLCNLGGPDAAKLWRASFEHAGDHRLQLRAPAHVAKLYALEIERQCRERTGLPIQIAVAV